MALGLSKSRRASLSSSETLPKGGQAQKASQDRSPRHRSNLSNDKSEDQYFPKRLLNSEDG